MQNKIFFLILLFDLCATQEILSKIDFVELDTNVFNSLIRLNTISLFDIEETLPKNSRSYLRQKFKYYYSINIEAFDITENTNYLNLTLNNIFGLTDETIQLFFSTVSNRDAILYFGKDFFQYIYSAQKEAKGNSYTNIYISKSVYDNFNKIGKYYKCDLFVRKNWTNYYKINLSFMVDNNISTIKLSDMIFDSFNKAFQLNK